PLLLSELSCGHYTEVHQTVSISVGRSFLNGHPVTRHLPSFPTRRSSDLKDQFEANAIADPATYGWDTTALNIYIVQCRGVPTVRDRKSTRLNSSHVEISYAVFCLKKKHTRDALGAPPYLPAPLGADAGFK